MKFADYLNTIKNENNLNNSDISKIIDNILEMTNIDKKIITQIPEELKNSLLIKNQQGFNKLKLDSIYFINLPNYGCLDIDSKSIEKGEKYFNLLKQLVPFANETNYYSINQKANKFNLELDLKEINYLNRNISFDFELNKYNDTDYTFKIYIHINVDKQFINFLKNEGFKVSKDIITNNYTIKW